MITSIHRRHRATEFKKLLTKIDAPVREHLAVHLVCDNYGTHKTPAVNAWLARHPRFHMHFTATSSSWINQSSDGSASSPTNSSEAWNQDPKPFIWTKTAEQILDSIGRLLTRISGAAQDGRYSFDGADHKVALTEPEKNNAIHGFLRSRNWRAAEREPDRVVMATRLHPLKGYPFTLDMRVEYTLGEGGLTVATTATNVGERAAPYGSGQHPYLSLGTGRIDDCTVQLRAATWINTKNERQLPTGRQPTDGTPLDFAADRQLGDQQLDFPFTDLARDSDRHVLVRLTAPTAAGSNCGPTRRIPSSSCTPETPSRPSAATGARHRADDLPTQRVPDRRRAAPPRTRTVDHRHLGVRLP